MPNDVRKEIGQRGVMTHCSGSFWQGRGLVTERETLPCANNENGYFYTYKIRGIGMRDSERWQLCASLRDEGRMQ